MQNNDEKMTQFLQYLESSGKLEKSFSGKYIEVYISILILWKTHEGAYSNHIRQNKFNPPPTPPKNDDNDQISKIFGISRHILGKHFP